MRSGNKLNETICFIRIARNKKIKLYQSYINKRVKYYYSVQDKSIIS